MYADVCAQPLSWRAQQDAILTGWHRCANPGHSLCRRVLPWHIATPLLFLKESIMKKLLTVLALSACAFSAMAQAEPKQKGPCVVEADAKGLKGDARKAFMTECRAVHKTTRKAKHDVCKTQVQAKMLKGAEAKEAMKACMGK
jgi:hypothetical protein